MNRPQNIATITAPTRKWFDVRNASKGVVEISIMDSIGGWDGVSAKQLTEQIKGLKETDVIKLHIFSPGGDVLEGNEIYNALKAHKGGVDVTLGALCASIATVIAMAGRSISMAKNGLFMIHDPWTFAMGDSEDLRRMADVMDKMKGNIVAVYKGKSNLNDKELADLMCEETWLTAEEAKAKGFVNEILPDDPAIKEDIKDRFDLGQFKNFAAAFSRVQPPAAPVTPPSASAPTGNSSGQPAAGQVEPKKQSQQKKLSLTDMYKNNKFRVFNGPAPAAGGTATEDPPDENKVKAEARKLYEAKIKRDEEIDEIVLAVRKRDKKDFSALAGKFKKDDKTPDEFARAIATSDDFKPHEVVGSGSDITVVGVQGLPQGSPGEVFVASADYRALVDKMKKGSRQNTQVMVETQRFMEAAMAQFMNATPMTRTGLTSIEKMPGIVTLGVRPLMVKDLIAPGATNNTTIRYIQEVSFTNTATTVAEGAAKPEANFVLQEVDATVKKIAAYTKVTDELFADFLAVASYINQRLPYMVERTEEDELLNGDGTGTHLLGILAFTGVQTIARAGETNPDIIYKAFTKVRWGNLAGSAQGGFEPDGIVIHPTDWETIRLSKDGNNQYYGGGPFTGAYGNGMLMQFDTLWGKPVVITPAIAQGTALIGAFRLAAQYFQRQGLTLESTNTNEDDFIKNLTTIRAEERLALAVYRPSAFCTATGLA